MTPTDSERLEEIEALLPAFIPTNAGKKILKEALAIARRQMERADHLEANHLNNLDLIKERDAALANLARVAASENDALKQRDAARTREAEMEAMARKGYRDADKAESDLARLREDFKEALRGLKVWGSENESQYTASAWQRWAEGQEALLAGADGESSTPKNRDQVSECAPATPPAKPASGHEHGLGCLLPPGCDPGPTFGHLAPPAPSPAKPEPCPGTAGKIKIDGGHFDGLTITPEVGHCPSCPSKGA